MISPKFDRGENKALRAPRTSGASPDRIRIQFSMRSLGFVADQDLSIGTSQQQGLNSRGFKGCILAGQEKRIQRFHELLNDYVKGPAGEA